jgi:ACS family tartrate transporter-like MFS transporter
LLTDGWRSLFISRWRGQAVKAKGPASAPEFVYNGVDNIAGAWQQRQVGPLVIPDAVEIPEVERRTLAKVKRYMLAYIITGQVFVQLDRTNIGFAQLTMSKELAISATVFGFASGVFALAAFFSQLPAGMMFERLGARRWLTAIMVGWGLVAVAQAFVTNKAELIVLRFLLGALESGYVPGVYILVSQWFRGNNQGTMISGLQIGTAASGILGAPFAGWILGQSVIGLSGWRSLFLVEGGLTALWALIALRILYDGPSKSTWLKPEERGFLADYLAKYQAQKVADGAIEKASVWDIFKDFRIVALILAYTFAGWVSATFSFFIPTLLKIAGKGLSNQTVGFMAMGPYIVMAVVAFTWGAHADRTGERHWHCVLPLLVGGAGMLLYPMATMPLVAMLCLALVQAGSTGFFVNFWPTCNMLVGRKTIAKSTALINAGTHAGSFVAPIVFGWALDVTGNPNVGLYICVVMQLMNFVIMNAFFFKHKVELRKQAAAAPAL